MVIYIDRTHLYQIYIQIMNVINQQYKLYSWGANSHGQLGLGKKSEKCGTPQVVELIHSGLEPKNIRKIIGGGRHTLILDKFGRVYSCGSDEKGQVCQSDRVETSSFHGIFQLHRECIADIVCGWDSSAAVTINNVLFVWGSNKYGQLGISNRCECITVPLQVTFTTDITIKCISMGLRHTAIVTKDGKLYVAGSNRHIQLGLDPAHKMVDNFTMVPDLCSVENVSCGQNHTLVLTKEGDIIAFGDNKHGQLGCDPRHKKSATRIKIAHFSPTSTIYAGWTHNIILDEGKIYSWGRNSYCQLGHGINTIPGTSLPKPIDGVQNIHKVAVGSEHNVAIDKQGKLFSWGWNEHANCGNEECGNVVPFPQQIRFPLKEHVYSESTLAAGAAVLIGSGYGHSFAVMKSIH